MASSSDIKFSIKNFILSEFLPGEDPAQLTDSTPLITTGILDSIAVLKLVLFLEEQFPLTIDAQEFNPNHFGTIKGIAELVLSKC
jgi:acyl carrier protein